MPLIIADRWLEQLCESQGINYKRVSRVIIDAQAGSPILMYITQFGDEGLITEVAPPKVEPPKVTAQEPALGSRKAPRLDEQERGA